MQVDILQLGEVLGNGTAIGVIVYWIIDSIRKWCGKGSPELRILDEDMKSIHEDLRALIDKLPSRSE